MSWIYKNYYGRNITNELSSEQDNWIWSSEKNKYERKKIFNEDDELRKSNQSINKKNYSMTKPIDLILEELKLNKIKEEKLNSEATKFDKFDKSDKSAKSAKSIKSVKSDKSVKSVKSVKFDIKK
jgi:hypothetical protein